MRSLIFILFLTSRLSLCADIESAKKALTEDKETLPSMMVAKDGSMFALAAENLSKLGKDGSERLDALKKKLKAAFTDVLSETDLKVLITAIDKAYLGQLRGSDWVPGEKFKFQVSVVGSAMRFNIQAYPINAPSGGDRGMQKVNEARNQSRADKKRTGD